MAMTVIMPKLGLTMESGTILAWHKNEGDLVEEGDVLCEVESDKSVNEISAPDAGCLLKILHREGDTVPVQTPIAFLGQPGEAIVEAIGEIEETEEEADTSGGIPAVSYVASGKEAAEGSRVIASPLARRAAKRMGIDLRNVPPAAGRRRIKFDDVSEHADRIACPDHAAKREETTLRPMAGMRKIIAERMRTSLQTNAQTCHRVTVDMTEARRLRGAFRQGELSYNGLICFAVCRALMEHPGVNAELVDGRIKEKHFVNLGVAVALDAGLVVPVVHNAHAMRLVQLSAAIKERGEKARSGGLSSDAYRDGTFTVSNLGMYGVEEFEAIINPPESAILAVGAIADSPAAIEGAVCVRPRMRLTLSYDHRVIDGAPAAVFIMRVKELLENPTPLL